MLKGFRDFIMRGNVIDLAVAFIIGGAFATVIAFLLVAAAIYLIVVKPMERTRTTEEAATKACPECASEIPLAARRCPLCTSTLPA
jgi:large conductance mechanosensitive channel